MTLSPTIPLNDGRQIPQVGLGVYQIPDADVAGVIREAILAGYRSIDTASLYENEAGVGLGVREAEVPREQLFVTTKVWNDRQGYDESLRSFDESMSRLGLDYVDLFLIHWPAPERDLYVDTWRALIRLREEGRAKSIGVSNFHPAHLRRIVGETGVVPSVNQIELHPRLPQRELRDYHAAHGIVTESWSPLAKADILGDPRLIRIAEKHGVTPAQVVLRWHLELGLVIIPKSVNPARIRENIDLFDFTLDPDDIAEIATFDSNGRIGMDPETFS